MHPEPVPAYDPVEHIDVTPVGDEDQPVVDPGTDPDDTYTEGDPDAA